MSCKNNVSRGCCFKSENGETSAHYKSGCQKMDVYDWVEDIENPSRKYDIFEVQFKNTRKGFYLNSSDAKYKKGDVVVVESSPGTNIGIITMCSDMVKLQMKRKGFNPRGCEFMKIIRRPNSNDIQKWEEAIGMEHSTMIRSRQICTQLGLDMKIGDVEVQADKMKAIFYYIADGRVDFRELIKVLAEQFRVRVEMKQIGSRQEAGLIGGIAACGRELCCSTWHNNFSTVVINAARVQDISPNPQKLAGQCGKLKCCLNYELDSYIDARERMPRVNQPLETLQANYFLIKTDVLRGIMYFSADPKNPAIQIPLTCDRVRQIQSMNRKGQKVEDIRSLVEAVEVKVEPDFENVVGQDSLTRFDKAKGNGNRNRNKRRGDRDGVRGGQNENRGGQGGNDVQAQAENRGPQEGGEARGGDNNDRNRNRNRNRKPQGDRPQGERVQGERQLDGKQQADRQQQSQGEKDERQQRPQGNRQQGERPQGERQPGDRPERQQRNRPQRNRPQGDRQQGERPERPERNQNDRPQGTNKTE